MPKADIMDMAGKKLDQIELEEAVWSVEAGDQLICEYVRYHEASGRIDTAKTKTKGEVRGGGAKPWRQKGTGRARVGSIRSPLWPGGGVVFGPRAQRNYTKQMNKKARRKALAAILSDKLAQGKIRFVAELSMETPSTRAFDKFLNDCGVDGTVLIICADPSIEILYSARNLPRTKMLNSDRINPHDLLKYEYLVMDAEAVKSVEKGMGL